MACADTSTIIDLLRSPRHQRYRAADSIIEKFALDGEVIHVSRITHAELLAGAYHSRATNQELRRINDTLRPMVVLELDADVADTFGRVQARLRSQGERIGDMDVLIAATCLANQQAIITANPRHFRKVQGLEVLTYL